MEFNSNATMVHLICKTILLLLTPTLYKYRDSLSHDPTIESKLNSSLYLFIINQKISERQKSKVDNDKTLPSQLTNS